MIIVGNKIYAKCAECGTLIRINKPLFGSMHICLSDEEIADRERKLTGKTDGLQNRN